MRSQFFSARTVMLCAVLCGCSTDKILVGVDDSNAALAQGGSDAGTMATGGGGVGGMGAGGLAGFGGGPQPLPPPPSPFQRHPDPDADGGPEQQQFGPYQGDPRLPPP
jgi:hypothetical protein